VPFPFKGMAGVGGVLHGHILLRGQGQRHSWHKASSSCSLVALVSGFVPSPTIKPIDGVIHYHHHQVNSGRLSSSSLDRYTSVALGGVVAEYLRFEQVRAPFPACPLLLAGILSWLWRHWRRQGVQHSCDQRHSTLVSGALVQGMVGRRCQPWAWRWLWAGCTGMQLLPPNASPVLNIRQSPRRTTPSSMCVRACRLRGAWATSRSWTICCAPWASRRLRRTRR